MVASKSGTTLEPSTGYDYVEKVFVEKLKNEDPQIEGNIFKSVENVNLSTIIAYKDKNGDRHHFKDEY